MLNPNIYMHESDRAALNALKAIPGFTALFKAFMKVWSEKQYRIQNMSTNLRVSKNQLSRYYDMLPPICKKLGIEVPELYLELDVVPNAYTAGDTKPFIVITSGLLEHMPDELIPTVLAHECGHIACHHCLYTTMGQMIMDGAINYLGIGELVALPIQIAFAYWMRCSEFSADRAAAIYDGNPTKVVQMCMHFSGLRKDLAAQANIYEFMQQAKDYQSMILDSKWNKAMEFLMFSHADHPLNAVRAAECFAWASEARFGKITGYLAQADSHEAANSTALAVYMQETFMPESDKFYVGKNVGEVRSMLCELGFCNISLLRNMQERSGAQDGQVLSICINNTVGFNAYDWVALDAQIVIEYYHPQTEAELIAAHPGQVRTPNTSKHYISQFYQNAVNDFHNAGFTNIVTYYRNHAKKGFFDVEGAIVMIDIAGQQSFGKGEWFPQDALVAITYNTYPTK